jgi:adenylate kinase
VIEMRVNDEALVSASRPAPPAPPAARSTTTTEAHPGRRQVHRLRRDEFKRRADDNAESLKQRLMEYYKKTSPLIGYYYAKGSSAASTAWARSTTSRPNRRGMAPSARGFLR